MRRSALMAASCFCCSMSSRRARRIFIALALFLSCDRSSWHLTIMPVGMWRDLHRAVGGVHALPAGTARCGDVDLEILVVDLDLDVLGLGQHGHGRRRGVDAALRLGRRHALHAVHAAFEAELASRPLLPLTSAMTSLKPPVCDSALVQDLDLPPLRLGVADVHAEQIGREQRRLFAALAAANLEDDVLLVVGIGRQQEHRQIFGELLGLLLERGELFFGRARAARDR